MKYNNNSNFIAGAYLRLSVEDDEKSSDDFYSSSIINQKTIINNFCKKNNITIYKYYIDDGYSGGNFNRPSFKKMVNDIENRKINCILTKDMSRLGRDFLETGNYIFKYFPEKNVRYISILDNYDSFNPNGIEDIIPFKAVINDIYLSDISKKIKSARHNLMRRGFFISGSVPYGYKRSEKDSRILVIDDYSSKIVKKIFNYKLNGISSKKISNILTDNGIMPPAIYSNKNIRYSITSNIWKPSTINSILKNQIYTGTLIQGKYERINLKTKKKRLLPKDKWIIIENAVPKIIDESVFNKVKMLMKKNETRINKYDYLLKNFVYCDDCKKHMLVRRIKKRKEDNPFKTIYLCKTYSLYGLSVCSMHYYSEEKLNDNVVKFLKNIIIKYSNSDLFLSKINFFLKNKFNLNYYKNQIEYLCKKNNKIQTALNNLYIDKLNNIISELEYFNLKEKFNYEINKNNENICSLKSNLKKFNLNFNDFNYKRNIIDNFYDNFYKNKLIICSLIDRIYICENKSIKICLKFNLGD